MALHHIDFCREEEELGTQVDPGQQDDDDSLAVNFALILAAFLVMTAEKFTWRDVVLGSALATVFWQVLQLIGSWYIGRELQHRSEIYGFFLSIRRRATAMGPDRWEGLESGVMDPNDRRVPFAVLTRRDPCVPRAAARTRRTVCYAVTSRSP